MKILKGEVLYKDSDFGISVQWVNGMGFCHCEVYKASRSILRACKNKIVELQNQYQQDAYGVRFKHDETHRKFLTMMGFQFFKNSWQLDDEGNDIIVEIWRLKYDQRGNRIR